MNRAQRTGRRHRSFGVAGSSTSPSATTRPLRMPTVADLAGLSCAVDNSSIPNQLCRASPAVPVSRLKMLALRARGVTVGRRVAFLRVALGSSWTGTQDCFAVAEPDDFSAQRQAFTEFPTFVGAYIQGASTARLQPDDPTAAGPPGTSGLSWIVIHDKPEVPGGPTFGRVVGLVELSEGPWMYAPLLDVEGRELCEGLTLAVDFVRPGDGEAIPAFRPA